jgi:type VI protein secretion system component Hcp
MRAISTLLSASFVAVSAFVASSARADGALITIHDTASNVLVNRATLNGLNVSSTQQQTVASSTGAGAGKVTFSPATFEIDSVVGAGALVKATENGTNLDVTIEFTTANAQGAEQVTSVGTFKLAAMKTCAFAFDDAGFRMNYSFEYGEVAYAAPPAPASTGKPQVEGRKLLQPMPTIQRVAVRAPIALTSVATLAPQNVDSVYLTVTGSTAAQSFPRTKVKSVSGDIEQTLSIGSQSSGAGAGKVTFNPFNVTQARSSPTLVFQQAVTSGMTFPTGTVSFMHTAADGTPTLLLDLNLRLVAVKSENVGMQSGVSAEKTTFAYGALSTAP